MNGESGKQIIASFNFLRAGRCIQSGTDGKPYLVVVGVSIPYEREGSSKAKHGNIFHPQEFQFPPNGKGHLKFVKNRVSIDDVVKFQFPPNGKGHLKTGRKSTVRTQFRFNSLRTGRVI